MNTLDQLKLNNDFIKGLLICLDDEHQKHAKQIIISNESLLLLNAKDTEHQKQNNIISQESLTDLLLNRGLPNTKALNTLCIRAIDKRGIDNFKIFLDEVSDYLNQHKANNINPFFNKCLCNFIETGRTPYGNKH